MNTYDVDIDIDVGDRGHWTQLFVVRYGDAREALDHEVQLRRVARVR